MRWSATGSVSRMRRPDSCSMAFPRTVQQAYELDGILSDLGTQLDAVLELDVEDEEVVRRLSGRRTCKKCGHIWHVEFDAPLEGGICDICGGELYHRDDDFPETVRHRLEVYSSQTEPLIAFYAVAGPTQPGRRPGRGRGRHRAGDRRARRRRRLSGSAPMSKRQAGSASKSSRLEQIELMRQRRAGRRRRDWPR